MGHAMPQGAAERNKKWFSLTLTHALFLTFGFIKLSFFVEWCKYYHRELIYKQHSDFSWISFGLSILVSLCRPLSLHYVGISGVIRLFGDLSDF